MTGIDKTGIQASPIVMKSAADRITAHIGKMLQCGNGQTNMPKQGFRTFLITFWILDLLTCKLLQCDAIDIYYKTYSSKKFNYQYLKKKNMFEICSNRVRSARTQVPASGMPLKLYLEVHLGHVETLNAPDIPDSLRRGGFCQIKKWKSPANLEPDFSRGLF